MDPQTHYVSRVLEQYAALPGTLHRVLREDRRAAVALYRRGVGLDLAENAFVLALARKTVRTDAADLDPIRSLHYFVPVVDELAEEPPLPGYLEHLRARLVTTGVLSA
jgi:hypothetical protein